MNYPLISEYIESIKSAEDNFEELTNLRPVFSADGEPVMTSGNYAVVFKMQDIETGKFYALKCFTKEQEGRAEAYHQIADALKDVHSSYLVSLRYMDKELFVDTKQTSETEFPVLLMDWVEGKTLDKYLRENLDDKYALEMLAYRFSQLAQWLIPQPFAHGDLKPDNIIVREDGTLVLVDYDGVYVPAMKGQKARELGSPDFRHPLRTENDFDEHIDDFPLVSILLSLRAISEKCDFFIECDEHNRLLFSEEDYLNINESDIFKRIFPSNDIDINRLVAAFLYYVLNSSKARYPLLPLLNNGLYPELTRFKDRYYSLSNKYIDEYGVEYTQDKKILLRWHNVLEEEKEFPQSYSVCEGTEIICDEAFMYCKNLTAIHLPKSLRFIGKSVFVGTNLSVINCDSSTFLVDDNIIYSYDRRVIYYYPEDRKDTYFEVPEQVKKIITGCFSTAKYLWVVKLNHLQYDFDELVFSRIYISIPKGTRKYINIDNTTYGPPGEKYPDKVEVRNNIFEGDLVVDDGVVYSSDKSILYRYPYWLDKEGYRVDENCKIIEEAAFDDSSEIDEWGLHTRFNKLKSLYLPNGLKEIKDYAFAGCGHIENLTIPYSVKKIGNYVFGQCVNLTTITFLSKIENFGNKAFHIGKTMPGDLVNPYVPYVLLGWEKNEIDIVICPNEADDFYKNILDNKNSQICVLDKNEECIRKENPSQLHDINYFSLTVDQLRLMVSAQLRQNIEDIVIEVKGNTWESGFWVDFRKMKRLLTCIVFDIWKPTNRFYYRQNLSGICYVTPNFRANMINNDYSFKTKDEAIDFICRVYFDANGNVV